MKKQRKTKKNRSGYKTFSLVENNNKLNGPKSITSMSKIGGDCFDQVAVMLSMNTHLRIQTGAIRVLMLDGTCKWKPFWNTPWQIHAWLIDDKGAIYDPAISNLKLYTDIPENECRLVKPLESHRAFEVRGEEKQYRFLEKLNYENVNFCITDRPFEIIYFPGIIDPANKHYPEYMEYVKTNATFMKNGGMTLNEYKEYHPLYEQVLQDCPLEMLDGLEQFVIA